MTISVVEGQATLTAFGKRWSLQQGRITVLDAATLAASGTIRMPKRICAADLAGLPLQYLPLVVPVAPALSAVRWRHLKAASQPTAAPLCRYTITHAAPANGSASDLPVSGCMYGTAVSQSAPAATLLAK